MKGLMKIHRKNGKQRKKEEKKEKESHHYLHEDALLELDYPDSLFDVRLFLTDDGRKRGLWIWLKENARMRNETDTQLFQEGLSNFKAWLDDPKGYAEEPGMLGFMLQSIHFDFFFGHRTEAPAIRLSWKQVKKLAAALLKEHKNKTKKTEEDW